LFIPKKAFIFLTFFYFIYNCESNVTFNANLPPGNVLSQNFLSLSGQLIGLNSGDSVTLQLTAGTGSETLVLTGTGAQLTFAFNHLFADNDVYNVAITSSTIPSTCLLGNGTGVFLSSSITNLSVTCTYPPQFSIGGSISGLDPLNQITVTDSVSGNSIVISGLSLYSFNIYSTLSYSFTLSSVTGTGQIQKCAFATPAISSGTVATSAVTNINVQCSNIDVSFDITGAAAAGSALENSTTFNIPINFPSGSTVPVNVNYSVVAASSTATPDIDYTMGTTLTIPAGSFSGNIPVTIIDDTLFEANETIVVSLVSTTGANLAGTTQYTFTILDNDAPTITINSVTPVVSAVPGFDLINLNWSTNGSALSYIIKSGDCATGVNVSVAAPSVNVSGITSVTPNTAINSVISQADLPVQGSNLLTICATFSVLNDTQGSATIIKDTIAPTNQNSVFGLNVTAQGGVPVAIASSLDSTNTIWFAPAGTTIFAAGPTMTTGSGTATSILSPSVQGSYVLYVVDAAGNYSVASTAILTVDTTAPVISAIAPATSAIVKNTNVGYTLSEAISSGSVTWTQTGGTVDAASPHIQPLTGAELATGAHTAITLTNSPALVSGAIYTITFNATDLAGNIAPPVSSTNVTFDNTLPLISAVAPVASSFVNNTTVSYTLSEAIASGSVTWTRTGGTADAASPHVQALTGAELTTGAHTAITLTNNPVLVNGAIYTITINATDFAGNSALPVSSTSVTYDTTSPVISAVAPVGPVFVNNTIVSYTLSEAIASGSVTWTQTAGALDTASPHVQVLTGAELAIGAHAATTLTNPPILVEGATYTIIFNSIDFAGNAAIPVNLTGITYDAAAPVISAVAPGTFSNINNTLLSYTLSEPVASGSVTWTQTGGTLDAASPHIQALTGGELTTGVHTAITLTNNPVLVDGAIYTITFNAIDPAGNAALPVSSTVVTYDTTLPVISAVAPVGPISANNTVVSYTLSEAIVGGTITWTQTGGTVDAASPHIQPLTGAELATGVHTAITLTNSPVLVNGAIYTITINATDFAGNSALPVSSTSVTFDKTLPVISNVFPATSSFVNNTVISYTLSEAIASGSVTWTRTGGTADAASPHIQVLTGAELATGAHTAITLTNNPVLVDGAIYTISFNATDSAGNAATAVSSTSVTYGTTVPVISAIAPATSAFVNTTTVSYTLSEAIASGSVTWTQTGGTADVGSPHVQALTGAELATGAHTGITLTNNPVLVDGAIYTVTFNATDLAGNAAIAVSSTTVTFDTTLPVISAVAPATSGFVNTTTVSYTLSEAIASGSVTWTQTGGTADGASPHVQALTGAELAIGAHTAITLTNNPVLVSGAIYTISFNATDLAGNAATAVSSTSVTYDTTLPVISAIAPATSAFVNTTTVSYTLSEAIASGSVTWTQTGGAADGASPHVQALMGAELATGAHTGITLTNNPVLVSGAIYTISFNATDLAGNAAVVTSSANVTFDTTAPVISAIAPAASAKVNSTIVSYTLSEAITSGSVTWTQTGGTADGASPHVQALTGAELNTGAHTGITLTNNPVLVDGAIYTVSFNATDLAGNAAIVTSSANVTFDTTIPVISAVAPATSAFVNTTTVSYTLSEAIASGSVTWTQTGGTADVGSPHVQALTGAELATGAHTGITLTNNPVLVSGAIYTISFSATDLAGNAATAVSSTSVTYDTTAPVISAVAPATSAYVKTTAVSYTLSEAIASGSVTWTQTGGTADVGSPHIQALTGAELATGAHAGITLTNNPILVNGAIYTISFNATDLAGNAATAVSSTSVTYDTTVPVISAIAPATSAFVNTTTVSYTLSEAIASGSVTWTQTGGTADVGSPHVQTLTGAELATGAHAGITLTNNPVLVSGAIYTVSFNATDLAGNAATAVSSTSVTYDTTAPVISAVAPATSAIVNSTVVSYTLSEAIASGSVTWTQTGGTADGASPHVQALTGAELATGAHTGITLTNNPVLVDGAIYTISFNATDLAGNAATAVSSTTVTFDTTLPVISAVAPATSAYVKTTAVSYTLSEAIASGSVTWTQTGGTADVGSPHVQALTGTELNTGAHAGITLTNNPVLVDGAIYTISFNATDLAGNAATAVSSTSVTYDTTLPVISAIAPATSSYVKTTIVSYTLSEAIASGSVTWTQTGGTADGASPHVQALTGAELATGAHTGITLTNNPVLVSGAIYTVSFNATDLAGNAAVVTSSANVTFDTTAPVISAIAPAASAKVNSTVVSYTLSEAIASGSVTWTQTGGTADGASPHVQALTGAELNTGAHTGITLTNNPVLVDGAIYTVFFNATDLAGNAAIVTSSANVTFDTTAPTLSAVSIASNNAITSLAATGNTITVSITAGGGESVTQPTVTIAGNAATVTPAGPSNTYSATYTLVGGENPGTAAINISGYADGAGNIGTAVTAVTDASTVTITAPPVAHWQMDGGVGDSATVVNDVASGTYPGTVTGAVIASAQDRHAALGKAYDNITTSDISMNVAPGTALGPTSDFTYSIWVKINTLAATETTIWNRTTSSIPLFGLAVLPTGKLQLALRDDANANFVYLTEAGTTNLGKWVHIEAVRSGNNFTVYKNGAAVIGPTAWAGTNLTLPAPMLGNDPGGLGTVYLDGSLDDFKVYNYARSANEVHADYNTKKWDGGGAAGVWTDRLNWADDIAPVAGDDIILDHAYVAGAYTVNLPATLTVGNFEVNDGGTAITVNTTGASLTVNNHFDLVGGTITGGGTITLAGTTNGPFRFTAPATAMTANFILDTNIAVDTTGAKKYQLQADANITGNLTITNGTLDTSTDAGVTTNYSLTANNVVIGTTDGVAGTTRGTLNAYHSTINVANNWTRRTVDGLFTYLNGSAPATQSVNFTGTGSISGMAGGLVNQNCFYTVSMANGALNTTTLNSDTRVQNQAIMGGGTLTGLAAGTPFRLFKDANTVAGVTKPLVLSLANATNVNFLYYFNNGPNGLVAAGSYFNNNVFVQTSNPHAATLEGNISGINNLSISASCTGCLSVLNTNNFSIGAVNLRFNQPAVNLPGKLNAGNSSITLSGNLNIDTGSTSTASQIITTGGTWAIGGNFDNSSTQIHDFTGSSVTLNGIAAQTISGNGVTFNNLTLADTGARTITFLAGVTTSVNGILTANAAVNGLTLKSSVAGTQAMINVSATGSVAAGASTLTLQDQVIFGAGLIAYVDPVLSADMGNNEGWFTPLDAYVTTAAATPAGSDTLGTGSKNRPFLTPKKAVNMMVCTPGPCAGNTVHIASGTYQVDYSAGTHVVMKQGVSLRGGYNVADNTWATWNPALYVTTIQDMSASGGVSGAPATPVYIGAGITSATTIEGLILQGSLTAGSGYSAGLHIFQSSPLVINSKLMGGAGSTSSYAIYMDGVGAAANPLIGTAGNGNIEINGGTGGAAYGIYATGTNANPSISSNLLIDAGISNISTGIYLNINSITTAAVSGNLMIKGGPGSAANGESNAIVIGSGSPTITNNVLNGGGELSTGTHHSRGILINSGTPKISANRIYAGAGKTSSRGIQNAPGAGTTANPVIFNNLIHGGDSLINYALISNGAPTAISDIQVLNNTIYSGNGTNSSFGIHFNAGTGTIQNNIIFCKPGVINSTGINEIDANSDPAIVQNNDIFACSTLYNDEGSNPITSVTTLNTTAVATTSTSGNIIQPVDFVGFTGAVGTFATESWAPSATVAIPAHANVAHGGLILGAPYDVDFDGGAVRNDDRDLAGIPPTNGGLGWTIGAYEIIATKLAGTLGSLVYVSNNVNANGDLKNSGLIPTKPVETVSNGYNNVAIPGMTEVKVATSVTAYNVDSAPAAPAVANHIILKAGINLTGGWNGTFATQTTGSSIIKDLNSQGGGSPGLPNAAIVSGAGLTSATKVDGFTIQIGRGAWTAGIWITSGTSLTVSRNTFTSYADSATRMIGVYANGNGVINSNTFNLTNPTGSEYVAIQANAGANLGITGNTINPGNSVNNSYGIIANGFSSTNVTISGNTLIHGGSALNSYGIFLDDGSVAAVDNSNGTGNTINGGSGSTASYGVFIRDTVSVTPSVSTISSNIEINGGTGKLAYGIYVTGAKANPTISNNKTGIVGIDGGSSSTLGGITYGVMVTGGANASITGNIIKGGTTTGTATNTMGVYISGTGSKATINSNNIFGTTTSTVAWSYGIAVDNGTGAPETATTITNNTINGGAGVGTSIGVQTNQKGSAPTIGGAGGGNTISGGSSAGSSYGIYILDGATPTITNNTSGLFEINGGSGSGSSYGVYITDTLSAAPTSATIGQPGFGNTITGGTGGTTYGIYVTGAKANPTITNNTSISGGIAATGVSRGIQITALAAATIEKNVSIKSGVTTAANQSAYAINMDGSGATIIRSNTVVGEAATWDSAAIVMWSGSTGTIYENRLFGGSGAAASHGIACNSLSSGSIYNNLVHGGTSATQSRALQLTNASCSFDNNTVYSGNSASRRTGIYIESNSSGNIRNNIIFCNGTGTEYGVSEATNGSEVAIFKNNNIFRCTTLYFDEGANPRNNPDDLNTAALTLQVGAPTGNINATLIVPGVINFMPNFTGDVINDVNWALVNPAPMNVLEGGLNLVATDFTGANRTAALTHGATNANAAGHTIGAYENNGAVMQLVFLTAPQSINSNTCSGIVTLKTQDSLGNNFSIPMDLGISITASSATTTLYSNAGCTTPTSSVTILANNTTGSFYFKETGGATSVTISTQDNMFKNASQVETITDVSSPTISSVAYYDLGGVAGKIDHVKITFNEPVKDSTFNAANWNIAGYTGIAKTLAPPGQPADIADNSILWLSFTEGLVFDSGAKPDLTTVAGPALTDMAVTPNTLAAVTTFTVSETDAAQPVLIAVYPVNANANVVLAFSETITLNAAGGVCATAPANTLFTYNNIVAGTTTGLAATSIWEAGACDKINFAVTPAALTTDLGSDSINVTAINTLYDANALTLKNLSAVVIQAIPRTITISSTGIGVGTLTVSDGISANLNLTSGAPGQTFTNQPADGQPFSISVVSQPAGQVCGFIENQYGVVSGSNIYLNVNCVNGYLNTGNYSDYNQTVTAPYSFGTLSQVTTIAGAAPTNAGGPGATSGYSDLVGTNARFNSPRQMAKVGNVIYIADSLNNLIRSYNVTTGQVGTLAGSGVATSLDGIGTAATFNKPVGLATDGTNLYVSDYSGHCIRKIHIATAKVSTIAGLCGTSGAAVASVADPKAARFSGPWGLAMDGGLLYIVDAINKKVRTLNLSSGVVNVIYTDASLLSEIVKLGTSLFVTSDPNPRILELTTAGALVKTYGTGVAGFRDGINTAAQFLSPQGIATDGTYIYVSDYPFGHIRRINPATFFVETLFSSGNAAVYADGDEQTGSLYLPHGLLVDKQSLYATDVNTHSLRRISSDLVAHYKLAAGSPNDSGPNANHATIPVAPNAPVTNAADPHGTTNAFQFDGNDYISAPHHADLSFNTTDKFTVSAWVKIPTQTGTVHTIMRKGSTAGFEIVVGGTGSAYNGKVAFYRFDGTNFVSSGYSTVTINDNLYHHITAMSRGTTMELYIDGKLSASGSNGALGSTLETDPFYLGSLNAGLYFLTGSISDVRVYRRDLSANEVKRLATKVPSDLVAYMPLDGNANDYTVYNRQPTLAGTTGTNNLPQLTPGRNSDVSGAYSFDGTDDVVTLTNKNLPDGANARTQCAWIKPNSYAQTNGIAAYGDQAVLNAKSTLGLMITNGYGEFLRGNGMGASSLWVAPVGAWSHLCGVYNGSTPTLYANGVLVKTGTTEAWATNLNNATYPNLLIGNDLSTGFTNGNIDDVRVYNRALSASEILELANDGPALLTIAGTGSFNEGTAPVLTVSLNHPVSQDVTFTYGAGAGQTADAADYLIAPAGPITIPAGSTSAPMTVTLNNDGWYDTPINEVVDVLITGITAGPASIGSASSAQITITDLQTLPTLTFAGITTSFVAESAGTIATPLPNLTPNGTESGVTVNYSITGTATNPADHNAMNGSYTFAIGSTIATASQANVTVANDIDEENNETIVFTMNTVTGTANLDGTPANQVHTLIINADSADYKGPEITAVEYWDWENNITNPGRIDHIRVVFDEAINDSTFPGYAGPNVLGNAQTVWNIAGYTGLVIDTRTVYDTTANDNILTLRFDEGIFPDTGAKPNLTANATSLVDMFPGTCMISKTPNTCVTTAVTLGTVDLDEKDKAPPLMLSAEPHTSGLPADSVLITFSEAITNNSLGGVCPASISNALFAYNNLGAGTASGLTAASTFFNNNCAKPAFLTTPSALTINTDTGLTGDKIAPTSAIYDAAGINVSDISEHLIESQPRSVIVSVSGMATGESIQVKINEDANNLININFPTTSGAYIYKILDGNPYTAKIVTSSSTNKVCAFKERQFGNVAGGDVLLNINCAAGYLVGGVYQTTQAAPLNYKLYQGKVSAIAGGATLGGTCTAASATCNDGVGAAAQFNFPQYMAFANGFLYVADTNNNRIRKVNVATNAVSTLAGTGVAGSGTTADDGACLSAKFNAPNGLVADGTNLYVANYTNASIRKISDINGTCTVSTLSGSTGVSGFLDGPGNMAKFANLREMVLKGSDLYVADSGNHRIRKVDISTGTATTLAGNGTAVDTNGTGVSASINGPHGLVLIGTTLYISTLSNHIMTVDINTGLATIVAGDGTGGYRDSTGLLSKFNWISSMTTDGYDLYITEITNHLVRRIDIRNGYRVSTLAGLAGTAGNVTGVVGVNARFNIPHGVVSDGKNLYVANHTAHTIVKISDNGLVGYWPLADNANDYSSDGVQVNGIWTGTAGYAAGRYSTDTSAKFTGTEYITVGDYNYTYATNFTMSAWINVSDLADTRMILGKGAGAASEWEYKWEVKPNGSLNYWHWDADDVNGIGCSSHPGIIPTGKWKHVLVRYNGTTQVFQMYIDGHEICTKPAATNLGLRNRTNPLLLGTGQTMANVPKVFIGSIADVRIYNRVMNEGEINELAQDAGGTGMVGQSYNTGATGLLSHFTLDSSGGVPSLLDSGPLQNTLAITGGAVAAIDKDGSPASAFNFNTGYLGSATSKGLPVSNHPRTVCAWANPSSLPAGTWQTIADFGESGGTDKRFFLGFLGNTQAVYQTFTTILQSPANMIQLNIWAHHCVTHDGTNLTLYLNGKVTQTAPKTLTTLDGVFRIGSNVSNTVIFQGKIDDVRIYNRALSADQIRQLAVQVPTGLVARYDFTGDSNDVSGFGNNLTNNGAVYNANGGRFGTGDGAYTFNNAWLNTTTNLGFPTANSARTVCAWFKGSGTYGAFNGVANLAGGDTFGINVGGATSASLYLSAGGYTPLSRFYVTSIWSFACSVDNGNNTQSFYYNGVYINGAAQTMVTSNSLLYIGNLGAASNFNPFAGDIDDVRVYNRALAANEILALSGYHPMQVSSWSPTLASSSLLLHVPAETATCGGVACANGGAVNGWSDTSGQANNLGTTISPSYVTTGIGSKPSIQFTSNANPLLGTFLGRTTMLGTLSNSRYSYFVVGQRSITGVSGLLAFQNANPLPVNGGILGGFGLTNLLNSYEYGFPGTSHNSTSTFSTATPFMVSDSYDGTNFNIRSAGSANGSLNSPGIANFNTNGIAIGVNSSGVASYGGQVSEVLFFNLPLTAANILYPGYADTEIVECYLSSKYGIAIGHNCP